MATSRKIRSLDELAAIGRQERAAMGKEKWQAHKNELLLKFLKEQAEFAKWMGNYTTGPEARARVELGEQLQALKDNATINKSEVCLEILDAVTWCLDLNWAGKDAMAVLRPLHKQTAQEDGRQARKESREQQLADKAANEAKCFAWLSQRHAEAMDRDYAMRLGERMAKTFGVGITSARRIVTQYRKQNQIAIEGSTTKRKRRLRTTDA